MFGIVLGTGSFGECRLGQLKRIGTRERERVREARRIKIQKGKK